MKTFLQFSLIALFFGFMVAQAAPSVNILGGYALIGTGLTGTTTQNTNLTVSGTVQITGLAANNDCVIANSAGKLSTTTCSAGGLSGSGVADRVALFESASTLFSDSGISYNSSTDILTITNVSSTDITSSGIVDAQKIEALNVTTTDITSSGIIDGQKIEYLNASGTDLTSSGVIDAQKIEALNVTTTDITSSGRADLQTVEAVSVSSTNLGISGISANSILYAATNGNVMGFASGTVGYCFKATSTAPGFWYEACSSSPTVVSNFSGITNNVIVATSTGGGGINYSTSSQTATWSIGRNLDAINALATTTGNLIVSTSTGGWKTLGVGTDGYVLAASSSAPGTFGLWWQSLTSFILSLSNVWTGNNDFGGATGLEVPNGTNPTVDATGELALDTTSNQLVAYDGTQVQVLGQPTTSIAFNISSPAADNFAEYIADFPFVIKTYRCQTIGGTTSAATTTLYYRTAYNGATTSADAADIVCDYKRAFDGSVSTSTIAKGTAIGIEIVGTPSGTPALLNFQLEVWKTRE